MSLCDRCYAPGACCKGFSLFSRGGDERTFWLEGAGTVSAFLEEHGLPFIPERTGVYEDDGGQYGSYRFSCPKLTPDGRCSIWRNRPDVCRDFEPAGGSALCVHSGGAEGTGDGL